MNNIYNLKSMIIALRNCDNDHIGEVTISGAKQELQNILDCSKYEIDELLKYFVEVDVTVNVTVK